MTNSSKCLLAELRREVAGPARRGMDRLHLVSPPIVPEVRLHLAQDPIVWWARMEAEAGESLTPPFWASAWAGGQAVARYILDHPAVAHGRRVLDLAAGSGLAGIAAGKAGAATVTANDIDPYALAATALNAEANGVTVVGHCGDVLDTDGSDAELVLACDAFYTRTMAERVLPFLERSAERGAHVLIGDPGREHLPRHRLESLATYRMPQADAFADAQLPRIEVFQLAR